MPKIYKEWEKATSHKGDKITKITKNMAKIRKKGIAAKNSDMWQKE